jgi:hypothetical protein
LAEISDLAVLAANNTARFGEGQLVPAINDGARELEAIVARWFKDNNGSIVTGGSANAYTILTNRSIAAHAAGLTFMVRIHTANTSSSTFTVNSLTAKPLRRQGGGALQNGDLQTNQIILAIYNSAGDYYECIGVTG